jgi:transcription antitermination factor NusG
VTPEPRLLPGTRVEITSGPLTGLTGTIVRRGAQQRFVVEVRFLQQGVLADVAGETLQALDRVAQPQSASA